MPRARTFAFRTIAVASSFMLAYSSSAAGINVLLVGSGKTLAELQARYLSSPASHFTERPGRVFLGLKPGRDASRSGWWTPQLRSDLERVRFEGNPADAALWASIGEFSFAGAAFQVTPGGGGTGGGGGTSGEGGGPSGGSGGATGGGGSTGGGGQTGGGGSGGPSSGGGGGIGGQTNTNTGNKFTTLPVVGWTSRGTSAIALTLYHSSMGTYSGAFGEGWSHSYEESIAHTPGSSAIVRRADGLSIPFTENPDGSFTPPSGIFDTLVRNSDGTFTLSGKHGAKSNFDASGRLSNLKDRAGNTVALTRDVSGKVSSVTDPSGRALTFAYNSAGKVVSVTDPAARIWTFARDAAGDLTGVTYPELNGALWTRTFGYNAAHDILSETDLRGKVWSWTYDGAERMTSFSDPSGRTTGYSYTTSATTITFPGGATRTHNYSSGLLASSVDEGGFSDTRTYNAQRQVTNYTDRRGKAWVSTYDARGNQLTLTNPLAKTWNHTYNSANDRLSTTDPLGNVTTVTYDPVHGGVTKVVDGLSRDSIRVTYDGYGQPLTKKDALNRNTTSVYNTLGEVVSVTDPAGVVSTMGYDALSRQIWTKDVANNQADVGYDAWGRRTFATHPGGAVATATYDRQGNRTGAVDEAGRTQSWTYDDGGRALTHTNGRGDLTSYAYNTRGLISTVTNGRGKVRTYAYTARGETSALTLPDGAFEQWSFNGNGDATAYVNPLGQTISYAYDDAGRSTLVDYATGTDTAFTYDYADRRTGMTDATGTTTWAYDAASQLSSLAQPQGTLLYTYNLAGQRTSQSGAGQSQNAIYDPGNGRLTSTVNGLGETTSFLYDLLGRASRKTLSAGQYEEYSYDARSRTSSITLKNSSNATLRAQTYTYDHSSKVTEQTVAGVTTSFGFDGAGQLTSESRPGYSGAYVYDGNGNRLTRTVNGSTESYAYDDSDKLTSVSVGGSSVKTYGYDAAGRTTSVVSSAGTTAIGYDFEGRATSIVGPGLSQSNIYNGLDTRVGSTTNSVARNYLRDGAYVTAAVLKDGEATYTPGISERRGTATTFEHSGLKSADSQTSTAQTFSATRQYDAFGNIVTSTGSFKGPFGYGGGYGYQEDATELRLLGHRLYDSSTGRFLSRDPIRDGRNWYAYCGNDPVSLADPSGLFPIFKITWGNGKIFHIVDDVAAEAERIRPGGGIVHHGKHGPKLSDHSHSVPPGHGGPGQPPYPQDPPGQGSSIHIATPAQADDAARSGGDWVDWITKGSFLPILMLIIGDPLDKGMAVSELMIQVVAPYVEEKQDLRRRQADWWMSDAIEGMPA